MNTIIHIKLVYAFFGAIGIGAVVFILGIVFAVIYLNEDEIGKFIP